MYDLEYRAQQTIARAMVKAKSKLWPTEIADRICYVYLNTDGVPQVFWLRKNDALNKKLKEKCVGVC